MVTYLGKEGDGESQGLLCEAGEGGGAALGAAQRWLRARASVNVVV